MDEILALYQNLHDSLGTNEICAVFCARMIQIIQNAVDRIPSGAKVGLRCADRCMSRLIREIDFSRTNIVGVYDLMLEEGEFAGFPLFSADKLTGESCDYVILATYTYRAAVLQELRAYNGTVIDIYSLLDEEGIHLRGPFNLYEPDMPLVLHFFYMNYLEADGPVRKESALRDFLQAAVEYKDFSMISRVYEENGGAQGPYPVLIETWKKAQNLLHTIQTRIKERKQKDIIAFWTDAINYFDLEDMPELSRKTEEGLFFEHAYTNAPWTRPVLQAIFQKLLPIDGYPATQEAISGDNSPLLRYLESRGYEFRWVSFPVWAMDPKYVVPRIKQYMSNSVIWWRGLQSLLQSEKPCFYIFHFLVEGHHPMLSPDLVKLDLLRPALYAKSAGALEQRKAALAYLDRCLMLYDQIFESKDRLFFSDHGSYWSDMSPWSEERLHVYLLALGSAIPKRRIQPFFSYLKFEEFIQWLIEPEENGLERALSDEVLSQDVDYYRESTVNASIGRMKKQHTPPPQHEKTVCLTDGVAYRSIRSGNYKYVIDALGQEFFYTISGAGAETPAPLEDDALRMELRRKCGTYFIDIRKHEKFKHSRKLYESILRSHPELGKPLWMTEEP